MNRKHKKQEEVFIDFALHSYLGSNMYKERTLEEIDMNQRILSERKLRLNKNWKWTKVKLKQLEKLNERLTEIGNQIFDYKILFKKRIHQEMKNKKFPFTDYEIKATISLWAPKKYKKLGIEDLCGNPFFSYNSIIHVPELGKTFKKDLAEYLKFHNSNWNEYQYKLDSALAYQHHCFSLHELYDHYPLAWEDILDTESIWLDLEIVYQLERNVRGKN